MASHGSKVAVYAAIAGNSAVMLAKFAAFALTGSGSLLAESMHSVADLGNQVLLAIGLGRAHRPADDAHPLGYGREAFVWALISAVGIFFVGAGVSVNHGIHTLLSADHELTSPLLGLGVLGFSFLLEGLTLSIALRSVLHAARERGMGFLEHVRSTGDPFGIAVLLEDTAATVGVIIAAIAIALAKYTGHAWWDGVGSIAVGVLLGFVALFLISRNRELLIGKAVSPPVRARLRELLLADPAIEGIAIEQAIITGTDSIHISAEVDFDGAYLADKWLEGHDFEALSERLSDEESIRAFLEEFAEAISELTGDEVDRIERRLREDLPQADQIALEPD